MSPNVPCLFDVMGQTIGFDPCPDSAFVTVAPDVKPLDVFVPVSCRSECPVASVVYALWMLRVGKEHYDGQDLIAAFRCSWPCDVQPLGVARVDGLDDLSRGRSDSGNDRSDGR